ncbi:MAG: hypothetical protein KBD78_17005 [Oligoflexales bacterium]|nr:hypothetical protein [Oligoflexales bacterium]
MASNLKSNHRNSDLDVLTKSVAIKGKSRLHIWVDEDKYQLLKILAVKHKSSVTDIMSECLDKYLESNE